MWKSRIILLALLIALSLGAFKMVGREQVRSIGSQAAIITETVSLGEGLAPLQVVGGDSADVVARPILDAAPRNATSSEDQTCGSSVGARFGLLRYLNSDTTLFERGSEGRWPIASITKLMTAIIASEQGLIDRNITFTEAMTATEGDAGNFKTGDTMTGDDILKGMLLISSNDAAEAFSQTHGSVAFISLMNNKAKELRMADTTFFDPSGLSPRNQSTANDLYKLMSYLQSEHPELLAITRQKKITVTELNTKHKRVIANINEFAGQAPSASSGQAPSISSGQATFIGGKTGYITEAEGNGNLVTLFTRNNQSFMIVVLGSPDRFGETRKLLKCI